MDGIFMVPALQDINAGEMYATVRAMLQACRHRMQQIADAATMLYISQGVAQVRS